MPTIACAAGLPEMVGAWGDPTLTPEEPVPGACVNVAPPEPTPTCPQAASIVAAMNARIGQITRPRRALANFIETPCFSRSLRRCTTPRDSEQKTEMADDDEPAHGMAPAGNPAISALALETGGFASPPRGGFAYSTSD
jgi:hypothetical protein